MPLAIAGYGAQKQIVRITGKEETRHFLNTLGFVPGSTVSIVSEMGGNMIVNVKDTRVAISKSMASHIIVN